MKFPISKQIAKRTLDLNLCMLMKYIMNFAISVIIKFNVLNIR